jgi:hypothetical protein
LHYVSTEPGYIIGCTLKPGCLLSLLHGYRSLLRENLGVTTLELHATGHEIELINKVLDRLHKDNMIKSKMVILNVSLDEAGDIGKMEHEAHWKISREEIKILMGKQLEN